MNNRIDSSASLIQNEKRKSFCQKWDLNPRPHTRTRTLNRPTALCRQGTTVLESGALDHSAILTSDREQLYQIVQHTFTKHCKNYLHNYECNFVLSPITENIAARKETCVSQAAPPFSKNTIETGYREFRY